jgi:hypothetical protein
VKTLDSGHTVGTTPELRSLAEKGRTVKSAWGDFPVTYAPRSKNDPKPWVSHGGDDYGFRYNARECYAEAAPVLTPEGEPTLEEYAMASRFIQSLIPGVRR